MHALEVLHADLEAAANGRLRTGTARFGLKNDHERLSCLNCVHSEAFYAVSCCVSGKKKYSICYATS